MKNQEEINDSSLDIKQISEPEKKICYRGDRFSFLSDCSFAWINC